VFLCVGGKPGSNWPLHGYWEKVRIEKNKVNIPNIDTKGYWTLLIASSVLQYRNPLYVTWKHITSPLQSPTG
jgi:hypothetical protein